MRRASGNFLRLTVNLLLLCRSSVYTAGAKTPTVKDTHEEQAREHKEGWGKENLCRLLIL